MFDEHHKEISFDEGIIDDHPVMEGMDVQHFAFSKRVARKIGERDNWTCQSSGKRFQDSNLVDIAHYHDKVKSGDVDYNDMEAGRVLSLDEHLKEHIGRFRRGLEGSRATKKIARRAFKNGLRTRRYHHFNPGSLDEDRQRVVEILERRGLDPRDFIDF